MKHLDEYRDAVSAKKLIEEIRAAATRRWTLMDVCGGQTHGLVRNGIEQVLVDTVDLIHGPGCPVCVTPPTIIDFAVRLSKRPATIITTFGDMLRVPGSAGSMMDARRDGGNVQMVYSPIDAVKMARDTPEIQIVFLGIGFETTAPATALAVMQASQLGLENFSLIPAHVQVLPAMELILGQDGNRVQGFLAAGHVCAVTGFDCYEAFAEKYHVPVVVTGFEPVDLLYGILESIHCLETETPKVVNRYGRNVTRHGNASALALINRVYESADSCWRGFGRVPQGGLRLRTSYRSLDANLRFAEWLPDSANDDPRCRSADVLSGRIRPSQCAEFGKGCRPDSPLGAPMVSSEGPCAAYFQCAPSQVMPEKRGLSTENSL